MLNPYLQVDESQSEQIRPCSQSYTYVTTLSSTSETIHDRCTTSFIPCAPSLLSRVATRRGTARRSLYGVSYRAKHCAFCRVGQFVQLFKPNKAAIRDTCALRFCVDRSHSMHSSKAHHIRIAKKWWSTSKKSTGCLFLSTQ